jgi:hypothetical protein
MLPRQGKIVPGKILRPSSPGKLTSSAENVFHFLTLYPEAKEMLGHIGVCGSRVYPGEDLDFSSLWFKIYKFLFVLFSVGAARSSL